MRLMEAMGLLRYNPAKMLVAFSTYYRDELERKVHGAVMCVMNKKIIESTYGNDECTSLALGACVVRVCLCVYLCVFYI